MENKRLMRRTLNRRHLGYGISVFWGSNDAWCYWVFIPHSEQVACGTAETFLSANLAADDFVSNDHKRRQALLQDAYEEEGLPYIVNRVREPINVR